MTAYNSVRFRVKPGMDEAFVNAHRDIKAFEGLQDGALIKTGDRTYCFIGKWDSMDKLAAARPAMISLLDKFRPLLEDLGGGLGQTDPVSGTAVIELGKH